jgi:hypothetical protein
MAEQSSAKLKAVNKETTPAMIIENITPGPATPAAVPTTTNMPAPMMMPKPTETASNSVRLLFILYWPAICFGMVYTYINTYFVFQ